MIEDVKVSIVTPSFNQSLFIEETILSVLNQTYKNIEYIVIDGGSTDGSIDIINKYSDKFFYWVSEKDKGQSHAINKGYEKCSGQLFAYLNSDDVLEPDAVEKIVNAYLIDKNDAIIFGKCKTINEKCETIEIFKGDNIDFNFLLDTGMLPRIFQPACFINRNFIARKPLLRVDLKYVMDYELLLNILKNNSSKFIDTPIAQYRIHENSKTVSQSKNMFEEKLKIQKEYGKNILWPLLKFKIKSFFTN